MCRFLVYKGSTPILLSDLVLSPTHSILTQSYDSRLRLDNRRPHNGDGFGLGYYTDPSLSLGPEPCIFTSTIPAWNCANLPRLASKTTSRLIFAHVRATTEGSLSDQNCHPFHCGSLMLMQNGGIGCWRLIKRQVAASLNDEWFVFVQGGTDSEWAFAIFLDTLDKMGYHPLKSTQAQSQKGFGPTILRKAMLEVIRRINASIAAIPDTAENKDLDRRSILNFAVTDGHSVICTRYISSKTDKAASLFFSSGTDWHRIGEGSRKPHELGSEEFRMERRDKGADIVLVASEPLTFERDNWVTVPQNSILTIHNQNVMIHPILDEFYNEDPDNLRSAQFAKSQGQTVTNSAKQVVSSDEAIEHRNAGPEDASIINSKAH